MPPKPFSSFVKDGIYSCAFAIDLFDHYPELGSSVLKVITIGSQMEATWARMLVHLLKSEAKIGLGMYEGIISAQAKLGALSGAAKVALSGADLQIFTAVVALTAPARSIRNDFAHRLWGESVQAPRCVILLHPKDDVRHAARSADFMIRNTGKVTSEEWPRMPLEEIFVYDEAALKEAVATMSAAHNLVLQLYFMLAMSPPNSDQMRQQLLALPDVQQALEKASGRTRPAEKRKSSE